MVEPYGAVEAGYYDYYETGSPGDTAFYLEQARAAGSPILELGCGTGRTLLPLAEAGLTVTGLELSPHMLDTARQKLAALDPEVRARVTLVQGDMRDFSLRGRFKLVTAPFRAFMHLLAAEDQRETLLNIRRHLSAGGRWVFNIFDPRPDLLTETGGNAWVMRRDSEFTDERTGRRVVVWYSRRYHPLSQVTEQDFILDELDDQGRVAQRSFSPLAFRVTFRQEMQYLLEMCGFRVEALYGDFMGGPFVPGGEQIWVTKRA
jgi:SAM-dependent methyltransferase